MPVKGRTSQYQQQRRKYNVLIQGCSSIATRTDVKETTYDAQLHRLQLHFGSLFQDKGGIKSYRLDDSKGSVVYQPYELWKRTKRPIQPIQRRRSSSPKRRRRQRRTNRMTSSRVSPSRLQRPSNDDQQFCATDRESGVHDQYCRLRMSTEHQRGDK